MAEQQAAEWNSELCDCFEDASTCCYGFWCGPCMACTVSGRFGESYCLPLCDFCSSAVLSLCGIPVCVPPAALSMRAGLRNRYNIKGSLFKDIVASCFCALCVWCQLHRELKERKKTNPTIINMNPQEIVNAQPAAAAPMMMMSPGNPTPVVYSNQSAAIMAPY